MLHMIEPMIARALENLPPDIKARIDQISQIALGAKAQLDRIERDQQIIMAALKITTTEVDNGQRHLDFTEHDDEPAGSSAVGGGNG